MPRDMSLPRQTGKWRWRRRFLRAPVLEVETSKMVWRPTYSGHTPANWVEVREWREAAAYDDLPADGQL